MLTACGDDSSDARRATATPTASAAPTNSAPATSSSTPTATPSVSPTATSTLPPTATATASETLTATPTNTPALVDELTAVGVGKYLGLMPASMMTKGDWDVHLYDPTPEQAICLRGGQYQVEVHHGTSNKVLLYLEGGGACWNYQTCWGAPLAKLTANPYFGGGIFAFDNPDNPFHDWNIVYAPYCDGSVFSGDNIADYQGNRTIHHGQQNLSAAVTLLRSLFPNPDQIVVAGSSAGGYGTFSGYGVTRVAFPTTPIVTLDDSGPGLQSPDDAENNRERLDNWQFAQFVPP